MRKIHSFAAVTALATAAVLSPTLSASAAPENPSGCTASLVPGTSTVYSECTEPGSYLHYAWVSCLTGPGGERANDTGPWVGPNERSYASCPTTADLRYGVGYIPLAG